MVCSIVNVIPFTIQRTVKKGVLEAQFVKTNTTGLAAYQARYHQAFN